MEACVNRYQRFVKLCLLGDAVVTEQRTVKSRRKGRTKSATQHRAGAILLGQHRLTNISVSERKLTAADHSVHS